MTARTHDIFAFASLLTIATYYPPSELWLATLLVAIIANIIGALMPDIDQASNRLWDLLPGGDALGSLLKNIFLSHRTISHSLLGLFIFFKSICWLIPKLFNPSFVNSEIVIIAFTIGYLSHLILDSFTEEGLPLLFPLKPKFGFPPIKSWRIKSGKWFEKYIVFPSIIVYIIFITANNWQLFLNIFRLALS